MLGPIVIVQAESSVPVYFKNIDLPGSVEPSAMVVVCVSAFVVMASVPKLKASADHAIEWPKITGNMIEVENKLEAYIHNFIFEQDLVGYIIDKENYGKDFE